MNQFDRNLQKIEDIKRKGRLKSENKIKEEQKYYRDHNNYLKERVHLLSDIKESKIPFYEKLPKDSLFYKHHIASMASKSLKKEAGQKKKSQKCTEYQAGKGPPLRSIHRTYSPNEI